MKNFKLIALLTLPLSFAAVAQTDPVADQIRLTQDAVRIALQEVENGSRDQGTQSADGDAKVRAFNAAAATALRTFEANVRTRILAPLQVLVNQYNQVVRNTTYNQATRAQILTNLQGQINSYVAEREIAYHEEKIALYRPLGNLPVAIQTISNVLNNSEYSGHAVQNGESCEGLFSNRYCWNTYNYTPAVNLVSGTNTREWRLGPTLNTRRESLSTIQMPNLSPSSIVASQLLGNPLVGPNGQATRTILENCYSSTCFYQSLNNAILWVTMVDSSLARDLNIRLADGRDITIRPFHPGAGTSRYIVIASEVLTRVQGGNMVINLPGDVSDDRLAVLRRIDVALAATPFNARTCQRAVNAAKAELARLPEGAISAAETALFTYRANGIGADRAACLN